MTQTIRFIRRFILSCLSREKSRGPKGRSPVVFTAVFALPLVTALLLTAFPASAAIEDQSDFETDDAVVISNSSAPTRFYGQSFITTTNETLTSLGMKLTRHVGSTGGNLSITIREGDFVSGTDLATSTNSVAVSSLVELTLPVVTFTDFAFTFSDVSLAPTTTYWIVFEFDTTPSSFVYSAFKRPNPISGVFCNSDVNPTCFPGQLDAYFVANPPPAGPQEIKVAVILAETKDADMAANTKDRIKNDDPLATDDIDSRLRSYFCENSFGDYDEGSDTCSGGLINIDLEIIDNNGQPFELDKDMDHYGGEIPFPINLIQISLGNDGAGKEIKFSPRGLKDRSIELIWDAINEADGHASAPDFDEYAMVAVVHEGLPQTSAAPNLVGTFAFPVAFAPLSSPTEIAKNWTLLSEEWDIGPWAHELAHSLGELEVDKYLCDLYTHPDGCSDTMAGWGLMGELGPHLGAGNHLSVPNHADGTRPSNLSSYSLIELGWLKNIVDLLPGSFAVTGVTDMEFGDEVTTIGTGPDSFYIVEARKKGTSVDWDKELPEDEALVVYRVRNATMKQIVYPEQIKQTVDRDIINFEKALTAGSNVYIDHKNDIAIIADSFNSGPPFMVSARYETTGTLSRKLGFANPDNQIVQNIETGSGPIGVPEPGAGPSPEWVVNHALHQSVMLRKDAQYGWLFYVALLLAGVLIYILWSSRFKENVSRRRLLARLLLGAILLALVGYGYGVKNHVQYYPLSEEDADNFEFRKFPIDWTGSGIQLPEPGQTAALPDIDLHAYDDQGNHVGMNYGTGLYENTIPDARTTGDRLYDEEWISVPEGTNVTFEVSTNDIEQFFAENPDIEASLSSTEETYTFGAVTYDATSQRYESAPVENIVINPGETRVHTIGGTTEEPTVDEGVVVIELDAISDTYLRNGSKNKNYGDETTTWIRGSGKRKTLVQFDQQAISDAVGTGTLISATLELETVDGTAGSWSSNGKLVGAYRLTHPWTELGATWNCGNDIDTSDSSPDCDGETWEMNQSSAFSWAEPPLDQVLFTNTTTGTISWDVTQDVAGFIATTATNYGWVVRKDADGTQGRIEFQSRETVTPPRLILEFVR